MTDVSGLYDLFFAAMLISLICWGMMLVLRVLGSQAKGAITEPSTTIPAGRPGSTG